MGAFLFLLAVTAPVAAASCTLDQADQQIEVSQIIDGDTIRVANGESVRLIAVNTPELGRERTPEQPLARFARTAVKRWIAQSQGTVQLRFDQVRRDRHGRLLAHVFLLDGRNLSELLLRDGLGFAIAVAPNLWQQACYRLAEQEAERSGRGVWIEPFFAPIQADQLNPRLLGFQRIRGTIQRIEQRKAGVQIHLAENFHLWINRNDWPDFAPTVTNQNHPAELLARGWITRRGRGFGMRLHHPLDLQLSE